MCKFWSEVEARDYTEGILLKLQPPAAQGIECVAAEKNKRNAELRSAFEPPPAMIEYY